MGWNLTSQNVGFCTSGLRVSNTKTIIHNSVFSEENKSGGGKGVPQFRYNFSYKWL